MFWFKRRKMSDLIEQLKDEKHIQTEEVAETMLKVDRKFYAKSNPYKDETVSAGYHTKVTAPSMQANILEALHKASFRGAKVLDVGSGTGYLTACFAQMVGETGKVIGVDHVPELVAQARENVRKGNPELLEKGIIEFVEGDGVNGLEHEAPFDIIHVGGACLGIPDNLADQLKIGGTMLIPLGKEFTTLYIVEKNRKGRLKRTSWIVYEHCPPLHDKDHQFSESRKRRRTIYVK